MERATVVFIVLATAVCSLNTVYCQHTSCVELQCDAGFSCDYGYVVELGCEICECQPAPGPDPVSTALMAPVAAPPPVSVARMPPHCDPLPCDVYCPNGHVRDAYGCRTCHCIPPRPMCPRGTVPLIPRRPCGRFDRCPFNSFCSSPWYGPRPMGRPGICCRRRPPPLPVCRMYDIQLPSRCQRHWDECNTDWGCPRSQRCCVTWCGRRCEPRFPIEPIG